MTTSTDAVPTSNSSGSLDGSTPCQSLDPELFLPRYYSNSPIPRFWSHSRQSSSLLWEDLKPSKEAAWPGYYSGMHSCILFQGTKTGNRCDQLYPAGSSASRYDYGRHLYLPYHACHGSVKLLTLLKRANDAAGDKWKAGQSNIFPQLCQLLTRRRQVRGISICGELVMPLRPKSRILCKTGLD